MRDKNGREAEAVATRRGRHDGRRWTLTGGVRWLVLLVLVCLAGSAWAQENPLGQVHTDPAPPAPKTEEESAADPRAVMRITLRPTPELVMTAEPR